VSQDQEVLQVLRDQQELKGLKEIQDIQEHKGLKDQVDHKGLKDPRVRLDQQALRELQDLVQQVEQGLKERMVPKDLRVHKVHKEPKVPQDQHLPHVLAIS
jgi:hypothetical protein